MSRAAVRAALEGALAAMSPAMPTAWENVAFTPTPGTAYQRVNILFTTPLNDENTASYIEEGYLQVTLCCPINAGPGAADARVELIRSAFPRQKTLTSGGQAVTIHRTPAPMPSFIEGDRYCVPVKVPFFAHIAA